MLEPQNEHFVRDFLNFSHFVASKLTFPTSFLMNLKICYLKIDVSCEASINLHHVSQNATPAMEFLVSISRSPDNAIRQEHATRHVRSVAPATQNDDGGLQSAAP